MKIIRLNETQIYTLIEQSITSKGILSPQQSDIKEFPGSEVSATCNVSDTSGDIKYGDPQTTDDLQKTMSYNNRWGRDFRAPIYSHMTN